MRDRYVLIAPDGRNGPGDYQVIDRREPDHPVCLCGRVNDAMLIVRALNNQYRDGAKRRIERARSGAV